MTDTRNTRHKQRMQKKKSHIDQQIAAADKDKGLIIVLTGNGKGKSSSAFGMVARALGHGQAVAVCQFIKARTDTGEEAFFKQQDNIDWHVLGAGFTWDTQDRSHDQQVATQAWGVASDCLTNDSYQLVVLDELTYITNDNYLSMDSLLTALAKRPPMQHVVITGRAASDALIEIADTVAEIKDVKHAFRAGIQAQPGLDW